MLFPASFPIKVLFVAEVKATPASIPRTVLPCGLPLKPLGTSPTYKESVSTKQSERPFKSDAPPPPPPAACNSHLPALELKVNTSPSLAPL